LINQDRVLKDHDLELKSDCKGNSGFEYRVELDQELESRFKGNAGFE
jgi:hypothetical protein